MHRGKFRVVMIFTVLAGIVGAPAAAMSQSLDATNMIQVMTQDLEESANAACNMAESLISFQKQTVVEMCDKQYAELDAFRKKYGGRAVKMTPKELSAKLDTASKLNSEIWEALGAKPIMAGNSDSPHHCSNNCKNWCGYNSLGDWICYNKCVKCCNQVEGASC